jgi:hypothetical protein
MKRLLPAVLLLLYSFSVQPAQADWTQAKRLTWDIGFPYYPALAIDASGRVHVVWQDSTAGGYEIFYKKSEDGGSNWSASKRLTWTAGISDYPAIAAGPSGAVHVVWEDMTPGNYEIFYKKSTDGGDTWTPNKRLTWNAGWSQFCTLTVDPLNRPHLVWDDGTSGNFEIYYKKSTNGGDTWSAAQRLTWNSGYSYAPSIDAESAANLHLVWHDNTPGNSEVYYKKSTNGGASWTTPQRLTWNSGSSGWTALAAEATGNLHIVWYDDTPGDYEIYYKKYTK